MSNDQQTEAPKGPTELDLLRERATQLGITFSGNTGEETLKKKIEAHLTDKTPTKKDDQATNAPGADREETEVEKQNRIRHEIQQDAMRMVRLRISNMNPAKADLQGEIISTQNKYIGTVRKFIPYGEAGENGYHVPYCLYEVLRDRQFNQVKTRKGNKPGEVIIEQRMVREFNIEILDPLTPEELAQLATTQQARGDN